LSFHPVAPCYDKPLLGRLQWRGQTPSCLKQVLDVMRQRRQLCLVQDLLESAKEQGWLSWGAGIVSSPVRWVWRKYQPSMDFMDIVYVDTQLLKVSYQQSVENENDCGCRMQQILSYINCSLW
jgi:hypothetical protein